MERFIRQLQMKDSFCMRGFFSATCSMAAVFYYQFCFRTGICAFSGSKSRKKCGKISFLPFLFVFFFPLFLCFAYLFSILDNSIWVREETSSDLYFFFFFVTKKMPSEWISFFFSPISLFYHFYVWRLIRCGYPAYFYGPLSLVTEYLLIASLSKQFYWCLYNYNTYREAANRISSIYKNSSTQFVHSNYYYREQN